VKQGKLPPIAERLPAAPIVLKPVVGIGRYGGSASASLNEAGMVLAMVALCSVPTKPEAWKLPVWVTFWASAHSPEEPDSRISFRYRRHPRPAGHPFP